MTWLIGVVVVVAAVVVVVSLFVLGACRAAGEADREAERYFRELQERRDRGREKE